MLQFNTVAGNYTKDQYVKPDRFCNGWTAINRGTGIVYVNGVPLSPSPVAGTAGESITIGGNIGELWGGYLRIQFEPGATTNQLVLIQKFYLNYNECYGGK